MGKDALWMAKAVALQFRNKEKQSVIQSGKVVANFANPAGKDAFQEHFTPELGWQSFQGKTLIGC